MVSQQAIDVGDGSSAQPRVPVSVQYGQSLTITNLSGSPLDVLQNGWDGGATATVTAGNSYTATVSVWLRSQGVTSVLLTMSQTPQDIVLGSDGTIGGPGGTALTSSVVRDSRAGGATLADSTGLVDQIPLAFDAATGMLKPGWRRSTGIDIRKFGAVCDAIRVNDALTTAGSATVKSNANYAKLAGGGFIQSRDAGKTIYIEGGLFGTLPAASAGSPFGNWFGTWSNGHAYKTMDVVQGSDANYYYAIQPTAGNDPTADTLMTYWMPQGSSQVTVPLRTTIAAVSALDTITVANAPTFSWGSSDAVNLTWGTDDTAAWESAAASLDPVMGLAVVIPGGRSSIVAKTIVWPRDLGTDSLLRYRPIRIVGEAQHDSYVYGMVPGAPLFKIADDDGSHNGCTMSIQHVTLSNKTDKGSVLYFYSTSLLADRFYLTYQDAAMEYEGNRSGSDLVFGINIVGGHYTHFRNFKTYGGNPLGGAKQTNVQKGVAIRACQSSEWTIDDCPDIGGNAGRGLSWEGSGGLTIRHPRVDSGSRAGLNDHSGRTGTVDVTAGSTKVTPHAGSALSFSAADAPQPHGKLTRVWIDGAAATNATGAQTFPVATLQVLSTDNFPSAGTLPSIPGVTGTVCYTGKTGQTFTGCTGGTGTVADGAVITGGSFMSFVKAYNVGDGSVDLDDPLPVALTAANCSTMNSLSPSFYFGPDLIVAPGAVSQSIYLERGSTEGNDDAPPFFFDQVNGVEIVSITAANSQYGHDDSVILRGCTDVQSDGGTCWDQAQYAIPSARASGAQTVTSSAWTSNVLNVVAGTVAGFPTSGTLTIPGTSGTTVSYTGKSAGSGPGGADQFTGVTGGGNGTVADGAYIVQIVGGTLRLPLGREPFVAPVGVGLRVDGNCDRVRFRAFKTRNGATNVLKRPANAGTLGEVEIECFDATGTPNIRNPSTQSLLFGRRIKGPRESVTFIAATGTGGINWTNVPLALTELLAGTLWRKRLDISPFGQVRLQANIGAGSGLSACRFGLQVTLDTSGATGWTYFDAVSAPSISTQFNGVLESAWLDIAQRFRADVQLRVVGVGGDGAHTVGIGNIAAEFR